SVGQATATRGQAPHLIAVDTATLRTRFAAQPPVFLSGLTFAGGLLLALGTEQPRSVRAWDGTTGAERGTLKLPGVGVRELAGTADALVLAGEDHTIRFLPLDVLAD